MFAAVTPVRQAYLNGLIESRERATVLSFDSLLASSGAVATQPLLGRAADVWGYPLSYVCSAAIQVLSIPFLWLARREAADADASDGLTSRAHRARNDRHRACLDRQRSDRAARVAARPVRFYVEWLATQHRRRDLTRGRRIAELLDQGS